MIFISYRRKDSSEVVGRIYDKLLEYIAPEKIFRDVDSIALGSEFPEVIRRKLGDSRVALVIIGPHWLATLNARKQDPIDYVRTEVQIALESRAVVIPVAVADASMPTQSELAEFPDLTKLPLLQGARIRQDPDFHSDAERLIRKFAASSGITISSKMKSGRPSAPRAELLTDIWREMNQWEQACRSNAAETLQLMISIPTNSDARQREFNKRLLPQFKEAESLLERVRSLIDENVHLIGAGWKNRLSNYQNMVFEWGNAIAAGTNQGNARAHELNDEMAVAHDSITAEIESLTNES